MSGHLLLYERRYVVRLTVDLAQMTDVVAYAYVLRCYLRPKL